MKKIHHQPSYYILLMLLWATLLNAQERFVNALVGAQIVNNAVFTVSDDKFSQLPIAGSDMASFESRVILEIDEDALVLKVDCNVSVTVSIKAWTSTTAFTTFPATLTLNFLSNAPGSTAHRAFKVLTPGGPFHKLETTVTGVTYAGTALPPLKLIGEIILNRKYAFSTGTAPVPNNVTPTSTAANFTWPSTAGAEEYDLEWTFFDAQSTLAKSKLALGIALTQAEVSQIFRFNSTRVNTANLQYTLPLTYPAGYILYRLRAARVNTTGSREYTDWSTYKSFAITTHEPTLNWQAQAIFAEEGKMTPTVRYFDNTLRERQTVTLSNSIGMTLASATAYDHQGRPAFSTLTAPTFQSFLKFDPLLAANTAGTAAYGKAEFDINGCTYAPPAMSSTLGIGKYYSPNNPNYLTGENAFIPDAKGFAYTLTEYTPDQTSRIRRQSAPGEMFRLSGGKETQYFYGKPTQDELDRLFGNDAGDATHYQKDLVIDPNGQASISYIDMHGRTVATSLAGSSPTNVNYLTESQSPLANFKWELLNNLKDEYSLTSTFNLLVPANANYNFSYLLTTPILNNLSCAPTACYDCAYDLNIKVIPSCGGSPIVNYTDNNYTGKSFDNDVCTPAFDNFNESIPNINLTPGEYTIVKTLSLNQDALNTYADRFIKLSGCAPTLASLQTQLRAVAYTTGCLQDCSNCLSTLDASYNNGNGIYSAAEYLELRKECYERCRNSLSTCDAIKLMLEGDMIPGGGQYAQFTYDAIGNKINSSDPTSIFYYNTLTSKYYYQELSTGDNYLNENNQIDFIVIEGVSKSPKDLTPLQFIEYWKPSWAAPLAKKYHPEYCYLTWCNNQTNSNRYEAKLLASETYQMAIDSGFFTGGLVNFFSSDPFFATSEGMSCLTDLQNRWDDMDPTVAGNQSVLTFVNNQIFGVGCGVMGAGAATANNDAAWRMLRAIYLSLVGQCKSQKRGANAGCDNNVINCIGNAACAGGPYNAYAGKERRVLNEDYRSQVGNQSYFTTQEANQVQSLKTECESFCDVNAEIWLEQLSEACTAIAGLSQPDKDQLKLRLAAVCKASCDATHPYGATTTPPGVITSYSDASIEGIITAYIGTTAPNGQNICSPCHANIINFPGAYNAPVYTAARTIESRVNTCACENYKILKDCYTATPGGYTSFADYLKQFSSVPFSTADMAMLEAACATSARNLVNPLTLPPYLECRVCKTCDEINTHVNVFNGNYCTLLQEPNNYYTYLSRYLNDKLGLNRSAEDYKAFLDQCATAPPPTGCRILMLCPQEINPTIDVSGNCSQILLAQADVQAEIAYAELVRAARANFVTQYLSKCLTGLNEQFYTTGPLLEYQYTLYYYDQSNLLTQTIPPAGVVPINLDANGAGGQSNRNNIRANRSNPGGSIAPTYPAHTLPTRYAYNTLGSAVKQTAPDHLENLFYYDEYGRLFASQDGRQRLSNKYSYNLYDALGRAYQTGEGTSASAPTSTIMTTMAAETWIGALGSRAHVTRTYYDVSTVTLTGFPRENLRSRVSATTIVASYNSNDQVFDYATHYSYDLTGDIATVVQDIPELNANGHRYKRIDYDYDQLSGKINAVFYQKGQADQFSYRYFYDLDNRLTQVMSSFTDTEPVGALWDREASYKYYLHGQLARTELGHYRVQGMDYAYTLQGWLKGLNASFLNVAKDMGRDANNVAGNANRYTATDAFAYTLGFYNNINSQTSTNINDYDPIGGSTNRFEVSYTSSGTPVPFHNDGFSQYTGNIRFIAQQNKGITLDANIQAYRYDQLMRLNSMNTYKLDPTALTNWNITTTAGQAAPLQTNYKEPSITYDRNGNIMSYQRWGASISLIQDNLNYLYYPGTNKLRQVTDNSTSNTAGEVLNQSDMNNYTYDGAGNLTGDIQSYISAGGIVWTPYGKVLQVNILGGLTQNNFGYDAMQNRIKKQKITPSSNISTYYVRDAQGNVLAVYEKNGSTITWKEQHLYGSSRLGTVEPGVAWTTTPAPTPYFRGSQILNYGWKRYEVNDHLGNVRALINDRKAYSSAISTFNPTLLDATDYFPFGAEMRSSLPNNPNKYRYGFNGKELDKNEFGSLNHYDYGFRIYNPGLGRFLSVDPLMKEYPWYTPYQFAGNGPIANLDKDGKEPISYMADMQTGKPYINPNFGNYEWMDVVDPKLNDVMTLRRNLNSDEWYVWKKVGDNSITGGAIFDPNEYHDTKQWSGIWQRYETPEERRYKGGIETAEKLEKFLVSTFIATGGLAYMAAVAPFATAAGQAAVPHILRGAQWAGSAGLQALNAGARGGQIALNAGLKGGKIAGQFLWARIKENGASAVGDALAQLVTNDGSKFNAISVAAEGLIGGKYAPFLTSLVGNTFSLNPALEFEFAGGAGNFKSASDRSYAWARNVVIGTGGNLLGELGGPLSKLGTASTPYQGLINYWFEFFGKSSYNFVGDGVGGAIQKGAEANYPLEKPKK